MIAKASANLAAKSDLSGFHCCGMDLVVIADLMGDNNYVIDFHVRHKSPGNVPGRLSLRPGELHYEDIRRAFAAKYAHRFAPRWGSSPTTEVFIVPKFSRRAIYNLKTLAVQMRRGLAKKFRRGGSRGD